MPAWVLASELRKDPLCIGETAFLYGVLQRKHPHVTLRETSRFGGSRSVYGGAVGLAIAEGAIQETTQLDQRVVAFLDPQIDDSLPALPFPRNDDDRSTTPPTPVR